MVALSKVDCFKADIGLGHSISKLASTVMHKYKDCLL